jgi:hypothetical protein
MRRPALAANPQLFSSLAFCVLLVNRILDWMIRRLFLQSWFIKYSLCACAVICSFLVVGAVDRNDDSCDWHSRWCQKNVVATTKANCTCSPGHWQVAVHIGYNALETTFHKCGSWLEHDFCCHCIMSSAADNWASEQTIFLCPHAWLRWLAHKT